MWCASSPYTLMSTALPMLWTPGPLGLPLSMGWSGGLYPDVMIMGLFMYPRTESSTFLVNIVRLCLTSAGASSARSSRHVK